MTRVEENDIRRRAVLHVGTMKTGTSTLQATLEASRQVLDGANWTYLGWPMRTASVLRDRLADVRSDSNLVISDEGLWHFCGTDRSDTPQIADALSGYDVTVVVYLRRPDQYVESQFSQGIKTGTGAPTLSRFLSSGFVNSRSFRPGPADPASLDNPRFRDRIDLRLEQRLAYFREQFPTGDLTVRPFERAQMRDGDIVSDFVEAAGLEPALSAEDLERPADANVSPSADVVLFANLLRQTYGVPEPVVRAYVDTHAATSPATRILRIEEAQAINAIMQPVFGRIRDAHRPDLPPGFFQSWAIDAAHYRESGLRTLYDDYIDVGDRS